MGQARRRTPAIFDRALGVWQPPPQVNDFVIFREPPLPASPIIAYRYGQDVLAWLDAFVAPHHLPFPYWQEPPAAANPHFEFRLPRYT